MTRDQDSADAAANPALLIWSHLIQGAAAVVIVLSLTLLLSPRLGEAIFNLVYFHQLSIMRNVLIYFVALMQIIRLDQISILFVS